MENIIKNETRRDFLKVSGTVAGGLALGFYLPTGPRIAQAAVQTNSPNAWIKIGTDNSVTIMCARSEMGQDVYTSMTMLVVEELEVDINKVKVEFAPPAEVYINALLGGQLTGGSTAVRDAWEKLRKAGASARMMLVAAAASEWGVDASQLKAANGMVTGYDDSRAKSVPGVKAVVQYSRGVAVVADSYWQAKKGKDLLLIQWDAGPNADNDQKKIWEGIRNASQQPGAVFREQGDVAAGMGQAAKTVEATYQLPFLSHSPMEPQNTTADVRADKAVIITPTQFQQLIPHVVAGATGLKPEQVEVHTTFLGGGFGRRVEVDYAIDAAEISKAVGAPVKMVWSREDDMTHDSYRPAGLYKLTAGLDSGGKPVAMRFHSTSPSISARLFPSVVKDGIDPFAVEGIDNYPYETPNLKFTYQMHDTGVTPGYWRAVSHNLNAVALECFIDEMAQAAGKDPIQYRIDMLDMGSTKHQWSGLSAGVPVGTRMKRVLEEVRAKSGWSKKMPEGKGMGVAVMEGYNTVIAMVAEVTVSSSYDVSVDKITAVIDAGTLVHPDQALAQMQSTINFGQSACLWGEITIKNGGVEQTNFDMYRVARMNENPKVLDIHFIKSDSVPGGLGEPGTAVVQPAIGNAIFAACGKRCRTLPFTPENIGGA